MADLDALYLAAYAVGQFMWGVFADRFGTRVVVLGGLLTSALAALMMGTLAHVQLGLGRGETAALHHAGEDAQQTQV